MKVIKTFLTYKNDPDEDINTIMAKLNIQLEDIISISFASHTVASGPVYRVWYIAESYEDVNEDIKSESTQSTQNTLDTNQCKHTHTYTSIDSRVAFIVDDNSEYGHGTYSWCETCGAFYHPAKSKWINPKGNPKER